jgi:hypothetical protein
MAGTLHRAKVSAAERSFRSRVAQLASDQWLLRGTVSERAGKCGLVQSHAGKLRQICVPQAWQQRVRQAVNDYRLHAADVLRRPIGCSEKVFRLFPQLADLAEGPLFVVRIHAGGHPEAPVEAQALQSAVDFVLGTGRFAPGARQEG